MIYLQILWNHEKYDLEKIKTIGDAYLVAGGLGFESKINAVNCVLAALEVQDLMKDLKNKAIKQNKDYWNVKLAFIMEKSFQVFRDK